MSGDIAPDCHRGRYKPIVIIGYLCTVISIFTVLFYNLGNHSISLKSDEVIYVRVTQGIVHTGDFWNLKHGSAPFFHKPPLKFAIGAIAPALFGEGNFTYRVTDASLGVLSCILVAVLSLMLFGNHAVAIIACLVCFSSLELTIDAHSFRRAALDGLLVFLTLVASVMTWKIVSAQGEQRARKSSLLYLGVVLGGCILTKSVGGLVPLICVVLSVLLIAVDLEWKRRIGSIIFITATATTVAGVYYLPTLLSSDKARSIILGGEILQRALRGYSGHNTHDPFFYLRFLFAKSGAVPSAFFLLSVVLFWHLWHQRQIKFLSVWAFVPVLLYSFSEAKTPWYISPAVPFVAILCSQLVIDTEYLSKFSSKNIARSVLFVHILLLSIGVFQLHRRYELIINTVASQKVRLPFDEFVGNLLASGKTFQVYLLENSIHGGTNPKKGKFNVEGIYRQMLQPNIAKINSPSEVRCESESCYIISPRELNPSPDKFHKMQSLPPFGIRKFEAFIYEATNERPKN